MPATRYQRYLTVRELHRQGQTQLQIAEQVGVREDTVAGWSNAPGFPERRIRSDRRRAQKLFLQTASAQPSLTRTHSSAGRLSALLNKPPQTLSARKQKHLDALLRFCSKAHELRRFILRFRAMMRWRSATKLESWIKWAPPRSSNLPLDLPARFAVTWSGQTVDHNVLEQRSHRGA